MSSPPGSSNSAEEELDFICECADETCVERVSLKTSQYDDVRAIPARFIVAPGHEATPLVERVIFRSSRFVIVRKIGIAADVARELDEPGVNPYWLEDAPVPRASPRHEGTVDVAVVGAGVTGCAAALRLAEAGLRVRVHDAARRRRGRERPQRRLRATRRRVALRRRARDVRRATRRAGSGAGRSARSTAWRSSPATRYAGRAAFASPPTRRSASRSAPSTRRSARTGSRPSGSTICRACSPAASKAGSCMQATARCSRRAGCAGSPRSPPTAGAEIREHDRVDDVDALDAEQVIVATDGYGHGLVPELADTIWPTRGQVIVSEPIDRVLYDKPHYARQGFDYWQQLPDGRVLLGGFRDVSILDELTDVEETTPTHPGVARAVPRRADRRDAAHLASLGRHLRAHAGHAAARRPRARPRRALGRRRLLRARQRARLRVRRARRGRDPRRDARRSSSCSIRRASSRRSPESCDRGTRKGVLAIPHAPIHSVA